ncbi:uncharacterized protein [Gossypium hirsutum]|uniref:Retrotransposon gag domain-containing protein n=1 Tax=Gossypium hirsutum TaxID=3635 RepID=A0A1U8NW59_GOSHI|nr:uncharacterized protein LOC107952457 [Gossypium hirsutum]
MSEAPISTTNNIGSQSHSNGDEALSQAMLRVLERVTGPHFGSGGRVSVIERFRSNGAKLFRGVTRVIPTVAEYWLEATERIMSDIDCTPEQKLKGVVSLLLNEAYQWWLSVEEGTKPYHLNWDFFKTAFQGKHVGTSYVDAHSREFMNLMQDDRFVAEFLRLSHYDRGMVVSEYEKCVCFEDGLRDNLRVLIAP